MMLMFGLAFFFFLFSRAVPLMMDKVEKFQIVFNNPTATYFAGETVYGYGWIVVKEALYVQSEYAGLSLHTTHHVI